MHHLYPFIDAYHETLVGGSLLVWDRNIMNPLVNSVLAESVKVFVDDVDPTCHTFAPFYFLLP